ncbi:hypothetical protein E4U53_006195 [Claviceps sorghi]|nr:hypothetical protein E4U53_006195 [Claviceps sorghi]
MTFLGRSEGDSSERGMIELTFPLDRAMPNAATPTVLPTPQVSSETSLSSNPHVFSEFHTSPQPKPHTSSARSGIVGSKRKHTSAPCAALDPDDKDAQLAIKRQRNTIAARKYRQKHLDRVSDLERALAEVTGERNELRLQLARREAEVDALREILART